MEEQSSARLGPPWAKWACALLVAGVAAVHAWRMLSAELALTGGELALPVDDAFIYLQYARALAEGHPFVYTAGDAPTTGSTSLWFPLLLAPPHVLGLGPSSCIAWSLALGLLGYFACALLCAELGQRLAGLAGGALALILFLTSPLLLWGFLSGMELPLYATALLGTTLAYLREREDARFPSLPWWLLALAGARPEGAGLCAVLGVVMLADRRRAARRDAGRRFWTPALLWPFAAAALPFVVDLLVSGSLEPTGSQVKSVLSEPYAAARREQLAALPGVWVDVGALFLALLQPGRGFAVPPAQAWINGAGILLFVALALVPRRRAREHGMVLFALLGAGIVLCSLSVSRFTHHFRYQHALYALFLVLLAAGWGRLAVLARTVAPRRAGLALAALAVLLPLAAWLRHVAPALQRVPGVYARNCENILHQQIAVGRWIDRELPADALVAVNDTGAIAYFGKRSTLDLFGLTTAKIAPAFRAGSGCLFELLSRAPQGRLPTHFAIYPWWFPDWRLLGILGPELFRAELELNTICGAPEKMVYAADWTGVREGDAPAEAAPRRLADELDVAWLAGERTHGWRAEPDAHSVLRRHAFDVAPSRTAVDGGRLVRGRLSFAVATQPGRELELVVRTDAATSSRLRVTADGRDAGIWEIPRGGGAWIEPRFTLPAALIRGARTELCLEREPTGEGEGFAPFHFWLYQ